MTDKNNKAERDISPKDNQKDLFDKTAPDADNVQKAQPKPQIAESDEAQDDLFSSFSEDRPSGSKRKTPKKPKPVRRKRRKRRIIVLAILCAILVACLAGLWYLLDSRKKEIAQIVTSETKAQEDFVQAIDSLTLPEGWSQQTLDTFKTNAGSAWNTSLLDIAKKAESGDKEAAKSLKEDSSSPNQDKAEKYKAIASQLSTYPESAIIALNANPDLLDALASWSGQQNNPREVVLEGSLETVQDLKTSDPRWAFYPYNGGIMLETGSIPVALSEIVSCLTEDPTLTPVYFADLAKEYGYEGAEISPDDSIFGATAYLFAINMTPLQRGFIDDSLAGGSLVILQLGEDENSNHFVVASGKDENGLWMINDPLSTDGTQHVDSSTLRDQIVRAYAFW